MFNSVLIWKIVIKLCNIRFSHLENVEYSVKNESDKDTAM